MPISKKCEQCGDIYHLAFPCFAKKARFCSHACAIKNRTGERRKVTCGYCAKPYIVPTKQGKCPKFCCRVCADKNRRVERVKKICGRCGDEFYVYLYRRKTAKFCSRYCADSWGADLLIDGIPVHAIADSLGFSIENILQRRRLGWTDEQIITTPIGSRRLRLCVELHCGHKHYAHDLCKWHFFRSEKFKKRSKKARMSERAKKWLQSESGKKSRLRSSLRLPHGTPDSLLTAFQSLRALKQEIRNERKRA